MKPRLLLLAILLLHAALGWADEVLATGLNEWVFKLPVSVTDRHGRAFTAEITVTGFRPAGPGPFPVALINHGRSVINRAAPARHRFLNAARYLVQRGFLVLVPTRLGYGAGGIEADPEESGRCRAKDYRPGFTAAADQAVAVLEHARTLPWADAQRVLVVGLSYGGVVSVDLAARNVPGLVGVVNFSGGAGGNPETHPGEPCRSDRLGALFADYGRAARAPSLWLYAENDPFFAAPHIRDWHERFVGAGGDARLHMLPPFGDNGHLLFVRGQMLWRPLLDAFLLRLGFIPPATVPAIGPPEPLRVENPA